jgi:hypothetical protein
VSQRFRKSLAAIMIPFSILLLIALIAALVFSSPPHPNTSQAIKSSTTMSMSATGTLIPTTTQVISNPTATATISSPATTATPQLPTATPTQRYHYQMIQVVNSVMTPTTFGSTIEISATCPQGTFLMSGGYRLTDPPGAMRGNTNLVNTPDSYPLNTSSWHVVTSYSNLHSVPFYAYANCLRTDYPVTTQIVHTGISNASDLSVRCPNGMIVTGGGWQYNHWMTSSQAIGTSWNAEGGQEVYAVCATMGLQTEMTPSNTAAVVSSTKQLSASIAVSCPSGQLLVGGGFVSEGAYHVFAFNAATASANFSSWSITVMNIDSVNTYTVKVTAVCLQL